MSEMMSPAMNAARQSAAKLFASFARRLEEAPRRPTRRETQAIHRRAYKARKRGGTVAWADAGAIRAIYAQARALTRQTGVQHHVDHIYPLKGALVCGLHVQGNLQILCAADNMRKGNRIVTHPLSDCGSNE